MYFQHDGVPPHYTRHVREYLNESFRNRWLGRGGPIAWPPRSPDLTPLDYYLWGHMNTLVYESKVDSRAALRHRILAATEHIRNHPDNIASATQCLLMRAENCIATGGGRFEQLLISRYCILVQLCSRLIPICAVSNVKSVLQYCWIFMCHVKCLEP